MCFTSASSPGSNATIGGTIASRKKIKTEYAEPLNRMIAASPNSNLLLAVPVSNWFRSVSYNENQVNNVFILGTTSDFLAISTVDCVKAAFSTKWNRAAAPMCGHRL